MLKEETIKALLDRGITEETASRLGWSTTDSGELAIPYLKDGKVVGTKYRTLGGEKRFRQEKGSAQILYNVDILKETGITAVLITEGEVDTAIALQCGYTAISVPNGAPSRVVEGEGSKYDYLEDIPDDLREIILCVDGDDAGMNLLHDLSVRLNPARCKWVKYPRGCKDLNDAFLAYGQRGVDETIKRAQWCRVDGIYRMSDIPPMPTATPIACPISGMGEFFKIRLGDFTVVTGVPGLGKTTFINEISCAMATQYGWNIAIASFEQSPRQDHLRALRTYYAQRPAQLLTEPEQEAADKWIDEKFTFILPDIDEEVNLHWIMEKIKAAIMRHGAKLIIIDPWNELDHDFPAEMTMTRYTGFAIKQFKKLARKYMVHIIVVAHPAKMQRNKDGGYSVPSLYDISDSAHWYNKCDVGIVIHREQDGKTLVKISKIRYFNVIGKTGEVRLRYDDYRNRFISEFDPL